MCGIVGYNGELQAAPVILDGLARLEYRGYDSAGIAVHSGAEISCKKAVGRLKTLAELTHEGEVLPGTLGIGHTRWATDGAPTENNAHPHCSASGMVSVVHNGIIENYVELKKRLTWQGMSFVSDTDTEVIAQLLDRFYEQYEHDPKWAIYKMTTRLKGSYALGIIFADRPEELYAVRRNSPLIVGFNDGGTFIASDVPAILKYTRKVYYPENDDICVLHKDGVEFLNKYLDPIQKEYTTIEWDVSAAEKGGYDHFMLKEIYEQPDVIKKTLLNNIQDGRIFFPDVRMTEEYIQNISNIRIIACGSASYVGMSGEYIMEAMAKIPTRMDIASEFRYRNPILDKNTLAIFISQSGETADTLASLRHCKEQGIRTLAIVNVQGSSIAREADDIIYTEAGPEIAVATTKAFSAQLINLYLLAIRFSRLRKTITEEQVKDYLTTLKEIPANIEMLLGYNQKLQKYANRFTAARDVYFIGRGLDYAASLEGSLKLKEISYIHAEAYAAGELKHGTISLIEEGTIVVAIMTQPELIPKTVSNLVEVKSRGAFVLAVTTEDFTDVEKNADYTIYIPKITDYFNTSLAIVPLQMLAYYVALSRGCDIDKPKNLAKSVTVE